MASVTPLHTSRRHDSALRDLRSVGGKLAGAIESISVPSHLVDPSGVVRWQNDASRRIIGDVCGRQYTSVVAPEDMRRARDRFARSKLGGAPLPDAEITVLDSAGRRLRVEVSSAPLSDGHHVIGVFGQAVDVEEPDDHPPPASLTPRQAEVLRLLERGHSTDQIAHELHLSKDTVRNHIRRLLRSLGVHTRLEAVAVARHQGPAKPKKPLRRASRVNPPAN